jgi:hypothetical protein
MVTVADGSLTVGIKEPAAGTTWLVWDNVTLTYLGGSTKGDVNRDGILSITDVTAIVNIILGNDDELSSFYDLVAADVNDDGDISIADVTAIVNIILNEQP